MYLDLGLLLFENWDGHEVTVIGDPSGGIARGSPQNRVNLIIFCVDSKVIGFFAVKRCIYNGNNNLCS